MSSRPWFAFYPGDYASKTRGLTMLEHGAYWLLLTAYYSSGKPLPSEAIRVQRIVGASTPEEVAATMHILDTYFTFKDGVYHHERADAEISKRDNFHQALSEAGRKGGLSKASRVASGEANSAAVASPQPQSHITVTPTIKKIKSVSSESGVARSVPPIGEGDLVAKFPSIKGEVEIRKSFVADLIGVYPSVMVAQEIEKARLWIEANPTRKKTNVRRFLTSWVARQQERA